MNTDKPEIHLKYWREQRGLSQHALADKLGVSRQTITNIETGRQYLSFKLLIEIAEVLGVTVGVLIDGPPEKKHNDTLYQLVIDLFERMPEHLLYEWLGYGSRILEVYDDKTNGHTAPPVHPPGQ